MTSVIIDSGFSYSSLNKELYFGVVHGGRPTLLMPWKEFSCEPEHPGHSNLLNNTKAYSIITKDGDHLTRNYKIRLTLLKLLESIGVYLLGVAGIKDPYIPRSVFRFSEAGIIEHLQTMASLIPEGLVKELTFRVDFNLGILGDEAVQSELVIDKLIETVQLLFPQLLQNQKIKVILISGTQSLIENAIPFLTNQSPLLQSGRVMMEFEVKGKGAIASSPLPVTLLDEKERCTSPEIVILPEEIVDEKEPENEKEQETVFISLARKDSQPTMIYDGYTTYDHEDPTHDKKEETVLIHQELFNAAQPKSAITAQPSSRQLISQENIDDGQLQSSSISEEKISCCSYWGNLFCPRNENDATRYQAEVLEEESVLTGKNTKKTATSSVAGYLGKGVYNNPKQVVPEPGEEMSLGDIISSHEHEAKLT